MAIAVCKNRYKCTLVKSKKGWECWDSVFFFFFFLLPFGLDGEIKSSVLHASALHTLANLRKTSLVYAEMISRMKGRLPVFQDTG